MDGSVLLSSPAFESSAPNILRELHRDQDFTDVTLVSTDHQQIGAHKVILSAASPFFRDLLVRHPHPAPLLYLKGVQSQELKHLLEYIYLGSTRIQGELLDSFLEAGEELKITGLVKGQEDLPASFQEAETGSKSQEYQDFQNKKAITKVENSIDNISEKNSEEDFKTVASEKYQSAKSLQEYVKPEYNQTTSLNEALPDKSYMAPALSFSELVTSAPRQHITNKQPAQYQCQQCPFKFQKENFLKLHMRSKHSGLPEEPVKKTRKRALKHRPDSCECAYCEWRLLED